MARIKDQQLDLDAIEISKSIRLIHESYPNEIGWSFNSITLLEPDHREMHQHNNDETVAEINSSIPRKCFLILVEKSMGNVYEVVVNLAEDKVERFDLVSTRCKTKVCFGEVDTSGVVGIPICASIKDNPDKESKLANESNNDNTRALASGLLRSDLDPLSKSSTKESQFRFRQRHNFHQQPKVPFSQNKETTLSNLIRVHIYEDQKILRDTKKIVRATNISKLPMVINK